MLTITTIIKEIKEIPLNKLKEVYQFVHALNPKKKLNINSIEKIQSFAGCFKEMKEKEYTDFIEHTKDVRTKLFDRNIKL